MARKYPANTQIQKFLEESYNKERDARLKTWYLRMSGDTDGLVKGYRAQQPVKSKQFEVFRKKIENAGHPAEALLEKLPKLQKERSYHRRISKYDDNLLKLANKSTDGALLVEMRPSSPKTRELLYDGFTKEGRGRYLYLQQRYRKVPEAKYEYPLTSSLEYGWKLGDVIKKEDIKKPAFGRTRIVADTFYTRTGIPAISQIY